MKGNAFDRVGTRIVATIGPATQSEGQIREMIRAGVDVFRFNMSHGTHEEHHARAERVREVAHELDRPVAILVDLRGPKIRTGTTVTGELVHLAVGSTVKIVGGSKGVDETTVSIDPKRLVDQLGPGDRLLLDDGKLEIEVIGSAADRAGQGRRAAKSGNTGDHAKAGRASTQSARARSASPAPGLFGKVVRGGMLKSRAGVNLPGRKIDLAVPTPKDLEDLDFALVARADFVALSFVQTADELRRVRKRIRKYVSETGWRDGGWAAEGVLADRSASSLREGPALIAKIERPTALEYLDAILEESDGVMVARGDLGVEISLEKVPIWQKEILRRARAKGVFSITATQMLESMIQSATPTRAEVSDVANAILDGTDAVMLSAESAVGSYPVESVQTLSRIARETERALRDDLAGGDLLEYDPVAEEWGDPVQAMARATVELAEVSEAKAIVVFTVSGRTGYRVSRYRPHVPIVCLTPTEATRRKLSLAWNTDALVVGRARTVDELLRRGVEMLKSVGRVKKGDTVVLLGGAADLAEASNLLRWVRV
ncbi:MAG: pyruvate kinase [Candidatus Eisenbacteria bacterium]|uniref:Pyruvate kinase n=1 Tax=Eiseniibacteriota bacterium TaxID=2212470 RepID=A0A956NBI7_UNCEI|nr:pyruvate kinase [Candidatus Eisenbacteria bacterium]MCB9465578.1 pyruvate kinase [Candidatus Eisenbacteria bacterium]